jgi:hypothetical protein
MSTLAFLLHPAYELATNSGEEIADGAQLVDGEWWHPQFGCDSLQFVVDNARQAMAWLPHPLHPAAARPGGVDPITQRGLMTTPKPLSPAAQKVYESAHEAWVTKDDPSSVAAAALRAAAMQMIKTDDLADTMEDVIRGAERHHQAGWLHTIATELEGHRG